MARHAYGPVQRTASAERFGVAEVNSWNDFRARIHSMTREEGVLVWNSDEMSVDLNPFRKFRSSIECDHWHHTDYEGCGQMVAVCHREHEDRCHVCALRTAMGAIAS